MTAVFTDAQTLFAQETSSAVSCLTCWRWSLYDYRLSFDFLGPLPSHPPVKARMLISSMKHRTFAFVGFVYHVTPPSEQRRMYHITETLPQKAKILLMTVS